MQRGMDTGTVRGRVDRERRAGGHNLPPAANTPVWAIELAVEVLSRPDLARERAPQALDRLRRHARAAHAALWIVGQSSATCKLLVDDRASRSVDRIVDLTDRTILERLRRQGALLCRPGDICGLEDLIPPGVGSFAAAAQASPADAIAVLVLGWPRQPSCDAATLLSLRLAAEMLGRSFGEPAADAAGVADAILGSLTDRIVALDHDGTIIAVNAAWTDVTRHPAAATGSGAPGADYFALFRDAVAGGAPDAVATRDRIRTVLSGGAASFQTVSSTGGIAGDECDVITATPLAQAGGGAVISHAPLLPDTLGALAQSRAEKLFDRLTDTLLLPVWTMTPEGVLLGGNERWRQVAEEAVASSYGDWFAALHPDDRARARAALVAAVAGRAPFELELRMRSAGGAYNWCLCSGAPELAIDGRVERYVGFCCDISARRLAESALAELAARLVAAQEAERSRIGRELHDDIGQQAALLAAKLEMLLRDGRLSRAQLQDGIREAEGHLQQLARAIHDVSHELYPAKLKLLGLVKTLDALCREVSRESGIQVRFSSRDVPAALSEAVALCVYRVAQEALQNAVRHSGASVIEMTLVADADHVMLRVHDEGRGFDPLASAAGGIGLLAMRERVELSGGRMHVDTATGDGTTIEAGFPIPVTKFGERADGGQ
jgi:signal transduction histidine kinase